MTVQSNLKPISRMPKRTTVSIHDDVIKRFLAIKPERKSLTAFLEDCLDAYLDNAITLGKPSERESEVLPLKAVNKEKDVDFLPTAEEVVRTGPAKTPPFEKVIPSNLFPHKDLLMDFWRVKKGARSERAWKMYMTEASKIQNGYGDAALREQLEIAAAREFDGLSLQNYEKFGRPASNVPTQSNRQGSSVDWEAVERIGSLF